MEKEEINSDLRRTVIPIMLIGDSQSNKTSLILRLIGNNDNNLLTTIDKEVYIYKAMLHYKPIKFKIWDTAGIERFKSMSMSMVKISKGIILIYSIAHMETFDSLESWLRLLNNFTDISQIPLIIVGNDSDLEELRKVSYEEGENLAKKYGRNFYEVSANTGNNVHEAFYDIFEQSYKKFEEELTGINPYLEKCKFKNLKKYLDF